MQVAARGAREVLLCRTKTRFQEQQSVALRSIHGVQDVYLVFKGGPVVFDWFSFA